MNKSCAWSSVIAIQHVHKLFHALLLWLLLCFTHAIPWRYANGPTENSPLQWKAILCAHLSCGIIDCDWLNCPEKRAIHLVNDMPQGQKWPENLAAFHTVKKQGWGWLRSSALCLAAATLLPQTATDPHKQPIVTQAHDITLPWVLIRHAACIRPRVDKCKHSLGKQKTDWAERLITYKQCVFYSCAENSHKMGVLGKYSGVLYISPFLN